jgi:pilus assembly protein CpaC
VVVDPPTYVTLGKSSLVRLPVPVARMVIGGTPAGRAAAPNAESVTASAAPAPTATGTRVQGSALDDGVAQVDITLLSPTELFLLGRRAGSMNLVLQSADGRCFIRDLVVSVDPDHLQSKLAELLPGEADVRVRALDGALVLTGQVSDALKLDQVLSLAASLGENRRVVNMLRVAAPQQVMVEVKIAEVSKTLLDRFGIDYTRVLTDGNGLGATVLSGIFGGVPAALGRFGGLPGAAGVTGVGAGAVGNGSGSASARVDIRGSRGTLLGIDAQSRDGLIRVLAEPNIMAISGQSASFLSGGRLFIPVAQSRDGGGSTVSLEEKEFGVGLKFTPTVLDGARVNLKLVSEVSDLSQTGSPFTTVGGVTSVLPSISTRRVDTTVQLGDGQSFAIAGLIKNNSTQSLSRFPGLGEIPILGALFRSTEYQKDQTELVFVVTPRLVRPLRTAAVLPTDVHVPPSRADVWLGGRSEGRPVEPVPAAPAAPAAAAPGPRAAAEAPQQAAADATDIPVAPNEVPKESRP